MRLGILPREIIDKTKGRKIIWLHTVSVGETQAIGELFKYLKENYPDFVLVVSTVTETGNKIARELIGPDDLAVYAPLDISLVTRRVFRLIKPRLFIIAETEIWPNMIITLSRQNIPVVLVNGRMSARSFAGYKLIRPFLKAILQRIEFSCVQTEEDKRRMLSLGAEEARVRVTGNMKFDIDEKPEIRVQKPELSLAAGEQLFIAGSTHRGEEEIIVKVYKELIADFPRLRLLIAPRHIERIQEIERLIGRFGFKSRRISRLESPITNYESPILLLDTIGQLKSLYADAELVFVGGSFIPHGGQNPIEPAIFAKAIIFGPYMSNFSDIVKTFLDKEAALSVQNEQQLQNTCLRLLRMPELRRELGTRAKQVVEESRGVTFKNFELIKSLIVEK